MHTSRQHNDACSTCMHVAHDELWALSISGVVIHNTSTTPNKCMFVIQGMVCVIASIPNVILEMVLMQPVFVSRLGGHLHTQ